MANGHLCRPFLSLHLKENKTLETVCLNRSTGKVLWRRELKPEKIEKVHRISTPVSATPATDGKSVVVYCGSYGLLTYDFDGVLQWERKLPVPAVLGSFGSGTSPIVARDRVIVDVQIGARGSLSAALPWSALLHQKWRSVDLPCGPKPDAQIR